MSHAHKKINNEHEYQLKHTLFFKIIKIILNRIIQVFPF